MGVEYALIFLNEEFVLQVLRYSKCRRNGSSGFRHSLVHEVKTGFVCIWIHRSAHFLQNARKASGCQAYYMHTCLFLRTPYFVKTIKLQLEVYNKAENVNTYLL